MQRRSLAESRPFPGNSRWCSAWLNSREFSGVDPSGVPSVPGKISGGMTSCPTPVGQQAGVVLLRSFVYTRAARCSVYTRSNRRSVYTRSNHRSVYIRSNRRSVYTRSNHRSVYTRSNRRFVYTRGWCIFTHTSVRGAASAWAADILPSSDCDGVCVTAVVRSVVWEMTLAVAGWYCLSPIL